MTTGRRTSCTSRWSIPGEGAGRTLSSLAGDLLRLSRPQFLIAGLLLNLLGAAMAIYSGHGIDWAALLMFQVVVTSAQLAGAMANEYADVETDALNRNRTWFSGGSGVIGSGRLPRTHVLYLCTFWTAIGLGAAAWLAVVTDLGLGLVVLVLLGFGGALSYSLGPLRTAYRGWGELSMALMVSVLCPATSFFVHTGSLDGPVLFLTVPLAFQMIRLMMVVQTPDLEADLAARKRNLVVRLGRSPAWTLGTGAVVAGALASVAGIWLGLPQEGALLVAGIMLSEAGLMAFLRGRLSVRRALWWSTAAVAGFYVLLISVSAVSVIVG